ncbi:unnamed protein product [Auanema sp. JU1783]|nr:unnamed protein product [Auanema sp. JU1783]
MYIAVVLRLTILVTKEGCLPAWFRDEQSSDVLEGSGSFDTTQALPLEGNSIQEIEKEENTPEDDIEDDFYDIYGTPAPIIIDEKVEAVKEKHKHLCKHYCYNRGTCQIEVDLHTYKFIGRQCICTSDRVGARCERPFTRRVYEPMNGRSIHSENSPLQVSFFLLIIILLALGLAIYFYRRCFRRHDFYGYSPSSTFSELNHLRRSALSGTGLSENSLRRGQARTPFSPSPRMYYRLNDNWTPGKPVLKSSVNFSPPFTTICKPKQLTILSRSDISAADSSTSNPDSQHSQQHLTSNNILLKVQEVCEDGEKPVPSPPPVSSTLETQSS